MKMKMKTRVFISVFILSDLTGPKSHQKWVNLDLSFHFFFPNKQTHLFDYSKNWKWKLYMVTFIWRWKLNTAAALLSARRFWFQFPIRVNENWKNEQRIGVFIFIFIPRKGTALVRISVYDSMMSEWASTTTREVFHTGAGFGEAGVVPTSPSSGNMPSRDI